MKLEDIHKLAVKYPKYDDFLQQLLILTKHPKDTKLKELEYRINVALGNKTKIAD